MAPAAPTPNSELIEIREVSPESDIARICLKQYYAELAARLDGGYDVKRALDPEASDMTTPRGAFYVALIGGEPVGCVGLKGTGGSIAEVKRLWTSSACRGQGVAKRLMQALELRAPEIGIHRLRLDTNRALPEAKQLYQKSGWREIERFNTDPYADFFFEKELTS